MWRRYLLAGVNLWEIAGVKPWEAGRLTEQDLQAIKAHHRARIGASDG